MDQTTENTDSAFLRRVSRRVEHPPGVAGKSLFDEATCAAHCHKWIESEKAGYDLGEAAVRDWHQRYWRKFSRERWMEHICGTAYWNELDNNDYGLLARNFAGHADLMREIVGQINQGGENLGVIQWAEANNRHMPSVLAILRLLDINSRRISHELDIGEDSFVESIRVRHKPSALVVDQDDASVDAVGDALKDEGMDVTGNASCDEALNTMARHRFDLFVIDMHSPGRHGAEVAWYLRRHGIKAPVVATSPADQRWCEDDLIDCGFTRLMTKPIALDDLRHIAREVVMAVGGQK